MKSKEEQASDILGKIRTKAGKSPDPPNSLPVNTRHQPKSGGDVAAPHPTFLRYLARRQEMRAQGETPPPSQGGHPFTLAEIDESIRLMEVRLETGQGTRASAMCRLSLDATKALRGMVADAQADVDRRSVALGEAKKERRRLEDEVARLLQRTWDEHQDNDYPCTCHDCRTYARNSGLWVEVTDGSGRVIDFKPAVVEKEEGLQ